MRGRRDMRDMSLHCRKFNKLENSFVSRSKEIIDDFDKEFENLREAGVIENIRKKWIQSQMVFFHRRRRSR